MDQATIKTEKLSRHFWKTVAVQDLDLEVPAGSVFALLGRNGAGKTTALRMLLGMLRPTSGSSTVFGLDSQKKSCEIKRRVGYVAEGMRIYGWMKIREALWFTSRFFPTWSEQKANELVARFGLDPGAKIKTLSRGMHAQVCLVLALAHDPELLVLDEATGGLDVIVRRQFLEHIAELASEEGKTVILASHLVHDVERVADWVAFIDKARLTHVSRQEALKESYRQIRLTFAETAPEALLSGRGAAPEAPVPGLLRSRPSGREVLLTVRDFSEETEIACRALQPANMEILDMTLEDLFEAIVGDGENP